MFVFSENISSSIGYPNNQEYIKWFALIIGLDAISSISFAKLRALNKATRFALIRLVNIFVNIGLNLFFIIYCPYAIENNLQSLNFVNSVYSPSVGVGYIFIANNMNYVGLFILFIFYANRGYATPLLRNYINHHTESNVRATVMSIRSFIIRTCFAIIAPFIGWIADQYGLNSAFLIMALIVSILGVYCLIWFSRNKAILK